MAACSIKATTYHIPNEFFAQYPMAGSSHFYKPCTKGQGTTTSCVNALSRAYPISTAFEATRFPEYDECQCP